MKYLMQHYLYLKSAALAQYKFKNKTDKAGEPYYNHCWRVKCNLEMPDLELQTIAILHDIIEDTDVTLEDLREIGFSERVVTAVGLLTHYVGDTYDEYIAKLAVNEDARRVKLADLKDNADIFRLKELTEKDIARLRKYHKAYLYLSNS